MSKFYIRLVREDGVRFNIKRFPTRKEAQLYLWKFYRCKNGIFETTVQNNSQWSVRIPTRSYRGNNPYHTIEQFSSYFEALTFARNRLGADSHGYLYLIDEI